MVVPESSPPLDAHFDRLSLAGSEELRTDQETSKFDEDFLRKWGFKLKDTYRLALNFYKEKEGKAVSLSYQDKLKLVALTRQISIGKFNPENCPPLGPLDVIGRDRRAAWQSLGDMNAEQAMIEFIELIDDRSPLFRPFSQAHRADMDNRRSLQEKEEAKKQEEEQLKVGGDGDGPKEGEAKLNGTSLDVHKSSIKEALNRQTYTQFRAYAETHFPGNIQQQEAIVKQLQDQHYEQYIEQLMLRLKSDQNEYPEATSNGQVQNLIAEQQFESDEEVISSASMWTRKDIREFKDSIRKEGGDAVIKVCHGETVTVRVPTNDEGTCLFWEFATDYYDIGFGVYFEWTKSPTSQVSVHVSESEDEDDYQNDDDDDDDDEEYEGVRVSDVERGKMAAALRPPLTEIVPVRRRDCMDQVFAGSHAYPGTGVYLLKFDNSFSLWRSKTLYYRVYYTR